MPCYDDRTRDLEIEQDKEFARMGNLLCELGKAYDKGMMVFVRPPVEATLFGEQKEFIAQTFQRWWEEHKKRDEELGK